MFQWIRTSTSVMHVYAKKIVYGARGLVIRTRMRVERNVKRIHNTAISRSTRSKLSNPAVALGGRIVIYAAVILLLFNTLQSANSASSNQAVLGASTVNTPLEMRVGSFNTLWRGFDRDFAGNTWDERLPRMKSVLAYANYDLVGMQEVWDSTQYSDIENLMPEGYRATKPGPIEGRNPIFYKYGHFQLISEGSFSLISGENKTCTWALFSDLYSAKQFYVFNVHLDYASEDFRQQSVNLILKNVENINTDNKTVFLLGDFNSFSQEKGSVDNVISKFGFEDLYRKTNQNSRHNDMYRTYHAYANPLINDGARVDKIFEISNKTTILPTYYETIIDRPFGAYASDHHPILFQIIVQ